MIKYYQRESGIWEICISLTIFMVNGMSDRDRGKINLMYNISRTNQNSNLKLFKQTQLGSWRKFCGEKCSWNCITLILKRTSTFSLLTNTFTFSSARIKRGKKWNNYIWLSWWTDLAFQQNYVFNSCLCTLRLQGLLQCRKKNLLAKSA